jgi:hypothetical protein
MADDQDLYVKPKRHLSRSWALILGLAGMLLLAAGGLALVLGARHFLHEPAVEAQPTMTLVPTYTPRPKATEAPAVVTLAVRPWTDDSAPVGLLEVTLSLPAAAQVSFQPPPGFRYWRGDLLPTRQGLRSTASFAATWSGSSPGEVRWYLLREPGATFPATLEVTVNSHRIGSGSSEAFLGTPQKLTLVLQPATPATVSAVLGKRP